MRLIPLFLAATLAAIVPACGGDDDDVAGAGSSGKGGSAGKGSGGKGATGGTNAGGQGGDDGGGATTGDSASKEISAKDGGEITLGEAALSIPGGALDGDTTVTVETSEPTDDLPASDTLTGKLYDFGPDGTEFNEPAKLTLPLAVSVGKDEKAAIAWLDEDKGEWVDLTTTTNSDGTVSAEISHFTTFVVRLNGVVTSDCGFEACGGDVVGTWTVTGACATAAIEIEEQCPDAIAEIDMQLSGTAEFKADGTRSSSFTSQVSFTYTLSSTCMKTLGKGELPDSCDELSSEGDPEDGEGPTNCTGDTSVSCTCVQINDEKSDSDTGTYVVDGNKMTFVDEGESEGEVLEFCVKGKEGRFSQSADLATITWIATKN